MVLGGNKVLTIVDESARLSHNQIKWLFAHKCAKSKNGRVIINWKKAKKVGFQNKPFDDDKRYSL